MLTNPLPHNKNMNSRTHDPFGGDQYLPKASGHGCIDMVHAARVVTRAKDYGSSQLDLGKEPAPLGSPLHIENPMDNLKLHLTFLKESLSVWGTILMHTLEVLQSCPSQRKALLSSLGVNN